MTELLPAQDAGVGIVRAFTRSDIPAVVALRRQLFSKSERSSARELAKYMEQIFFDGPLADSRLSSYVYLDEDGRVAGFMGVVPRQMLFGGHTLRVAVGTQLMVAAHCRGLAARRLARALIQGPQDLTISDAANSAARSIWASVGGRTALAYSLCWTRALRPARYAALRASKVNLASRALAFAARPLCAAADAAFAPQSRRERARLLRSTIEPMDIARHLPELSEVLERWSLRPRYEPKSLEFVLADVAARKRFGDLQRVAVRDTNGQLIGWFLYCLSRGGISTVVQFAATKGSTDLVVARMLDHARRLGAIALAGRFDASTVQELSDAGADFRREGPWMLYHSRHLGVERAIEAGDAFLSRLEGEWWMSF
jgi:hypothetical protein